ncbi:hypothetical protein [Streptomyces sp. NPDC005538]|uniref:hypothetical protein n=1 Tax=unclassified Streptomyces TaxID=2593676 RepID=UPI0033A7444F
MVGRQHRGDENGTTWYRYAKVTLGQSGPPPSPSSSGSAFQGTTGHVRINCKPENWPRGTVVAVTPAGSRPSCGGPAAQFPAHASGRRHEQVRALRARCAEVPDAQRTQTPDSAESHLIR